MRSPVGAFGADGEEESVAVAASTDSHSSDGGVVHDFGGDEVCGGFHDSVESFSWQVTNLERDGRCFCERFDRGG